jgi:hypothetical protein
LVSEVVVAFVVVVGGVYQVFALNSRWSSNARRIVVVVAIPFSHLHSVTWLAPLDFMSSIPAVIIPFNGASILFELVWNTAVTMPLPLPQPPSGAAGLNCTISYNVAVAVSPVSVLTVSFP